MLIEILPFLIEHMVVFAWRNRYWWKKL